MHKAIYLAILFVLPATLVFGQDEKIQVPAFGDKYSNYVAQLEGGNADIDYADFRNSFLDSKQYSNKGTNYNDLRKKVDTAIKEKDYQAVVKLTKAMLSIDYTSMFAHKFLYQTYRVLGDTVNAKKYQDIEIGLLKSIVNSGDGKTCETGWHVTQIEEEYFLLNIIGLQLESQTIATSAKNACDKMNVKSEEGEKRTIFFEANMVFEMERKLFGR